MEFGLIFGYELQEEKRMKEGSILQKIGLQSLILKLNIDGEKQKGPKIITQVSLFLGSNDERTGGESWFMGKEHLRLFLLTTPSFVAVVVVVVDCCHCCRREELLQSTVFPIAPARREYCDRELSP